VIPNAAKDETYLRSAEVAPILRVSAKTVSRWAKDGKLPFVRTLGGHRRYPESEIRALAASLEEHGERYPGPWQQIQTPPARRSAT
jgi:excisionase family DNA binding protein